MILWDYRTSCKKLTGEIPFNIVYGQEVVMPIEYIVPILSIAAVKDMSVQDWKSGSFTTSLTHRKVTELSTTKSITQHVKTSTLTAI